MKSAICLGGSGLKLRLILYFSHSPLPLEGSVNDSNFIRNRALRNLGRIICRAFQGLGACGAFSVSLTIFYEFIPPAKYPLYGALMSTLSVFGSLGGPLLGGIIDNTSTWRWIFFFQIPVVSLVLTFVIFLLPEKFSYHGSPALVAPPIVQVPQEIDFLGAFLLLCASIHLITVLLEVSTKFGCHYMSFDCFWCDVDSIWWMGTSFLVSIPSQVINIDIPQKAQAVYAYTLAVPVDSIVSNTIISRTKIAPIYLLFCSTALQTLGVNHIPGQLHFFEVMVTFGVDGSFALLIVLNPLCIESKYTAIASGAVVQFRMTGCTLGLAAVTTALNNYLSSHLPDVLTPAQLKDVLQSTSAISSLSPELKFRGYNLQLPILIGFTAAQFFALCLIWNKPQLGI
ncbi:major facilitator superfamily transporter protein [Rutstroemia sp. NJR-2017a BVV2]|nr:major facilitator superfamily transporter protein [Rutstroemia sp. NJR-2017a BVV2]